MQKRTVAQSVFDSPMALAAAKRGHRQACAEMAEAWNRGDQVGEGDPNHPMYNGGFDPRKLFGRSVQAHLDLQRKQ